MSDTTRQTTGTPSVLDGIRVLELVNGLANAQAGQLLADYGAEVIQIEPPGGGPLRRYPAYAFWGRGKKSVEVDLKTEGGQETVRALARTSDIVLTSWRPGVAERLGLDYETLASDNPRLVYSAITGWGETGPYADYPGYEGLVMAKVGAMHAFSAMARRDGPAFISVPYASWSATQAALQGVFAALLDRENSGHGQRVATSLALAVAAQEPYNQVIEVVTKRYPEAFIATSPYGDDLRSNTDFSLRLLIGLTADGRWMQFPQVQPHLLAAFMRAAGLEWMLTDAEWAATFTFEDRSKVTEANNILLEAVRKRTYAEWEEVFASDPNVFAELFRTGRELLDHPQMQYDNNVIRVRDSERGWTRQPAPIVKFDRSPAALPTSAPPLNANAADVAKWIAAYQDPAGTPAAPAGNLPLDGITIIEFGTFYAGPYGLTLLTDLGARVLKIEPLDGDPIRFLQPFPETGAAKVLQGKESIALDLAAPEAREIVAELVRNAQLALCSYRAGVAKRLGVDADSILTINPDIMYLDTPGYGTSGPHARRAAFAATISAGTGVSMRNMGPAGSADPSGWDTDEVRKFSVALNVAGVSGGVQPDGIAGLAVGTVAAMALFAQRRGLGGQRLMTSMVHSAAHSLSESIVDHELTDNFPTVDAGHHGLSALYRLYRSAEEGWIFLAAPRQRDWDRLVQYLGDSEPSLLDARFSTEQGRQQYDTELVEILARIFATRPAADWEKELTHAGVGCVVAERRTMAQSYMGEFGEQSGYLADVVSPIFDEYPRIGPLVRFSRSATRALAGSLIGQHTDAVLAEFGFSDDQIGLLRERGVIL